MSYTKMLTSRAAEPAPWPYAHSAPGKSMLTLPGLGDGRFGLAFGAASKTAEEASTSGATETAVARFYAVIRAQAATGRFDIAALGQAYENLARDFPIAGQYVAAREYIFGQVDGMNPDAGRALRIAYHAVETGARVAAAMGAQAAILAASNYGAANASILAASQAMSSMAGPVGLGVALVTGILTGIFGGDDDATIYARQIESHANAKAAIAALSTWPEAARQAFMATSYYTSLKAMADDLSINDPLNFINDPVLREALRTAVFAQTGTILGDDDLKKAFKAKLAEKAAKKAATPVAQKNLVSRSVTKNSSSSISASAGVSIVLGIGGGVAALGLGQWALKRYRKGRR